MKRLTEIDSVKAYWNIDNTQNGGFEVTQKLGKLEDIEDELGIDLITLLKAVKNGVWVRHPYNSINYEPFRIDYWKDCKTNEEGMLVCGMKIKDYGKTWALTKEELL